MDTPNEMLAPSVVTRELVPRGARLVIQQTTECETITKDTCHLTGPSDGKAGFNKQAQGHCTADVP